MKDNTSRADAEFTSWLMQSPQAHRAAAATIVPEAGPPPVVKKHFFAEKKADTEITPTEANLPEATRKAPLQGGGVTRFDNDIGNLPGPDMRPMLMSTAPEKGKRAPAPNARAVAAGIVESLRRRVPASPVPAAPVARGVPDDLSLNKISSVLRAVGAPPALVTEQSVLWSAACEKIASAGEEKELGDMISGDDAHPVALFMSLGQRYGDEWLSWDLEVVQTTLAGDVGQEPSSATMNKVAALKMLVNKPDSAYTDWYAFEKMAVAFDGGAPRLSMIEDLAPEQMAMAASVIRMISGHTGVSQPFSPEMKKYCAARLFDAGFVVAPPELGFCDEDLAQITGDPDLRKKSLAMYAQALAGTEPRDIDQDLPPADFVQAARLMRVHAYVLGKVDDLIRQAQ